MAIDWKSVPKRFNYLRNLVLDTRLDEVRVAEYDPQLGRHVTLGEKLSADEISEVTRVYDDICQREDNLALLDWFDEARSGSTPEKDAAWYIEGLLFLFQDLANLDVKPFADRGILVERPPPPLDWSKLPPDLAYLEQAVETYRELDREGKICDWLSAATHDQIADLEQLARKMFCDNDRIENWCEQFRGDPEEFRVDWLYLIFDHAGIEGP